MQPLKCIEEQNEPLQFLYFNSSPAMFLIVLTRSILVNKVFSVITLSLKTKLLNYTVVAPNKTKYSSFIAVLINANLIE